MSARKLPRWSLAALCLPLALIFGWAAKTLPWDDFTFFAVANGIFAALHLATAICAIAGARVLRGVWRLQSALGFAYLGYVGWGALSSAFYVRSLYGGLGDGVAAALLAVLGLIAALVLPMSIWGLAATGGVRLGKIGAGALVVVALLVGLRLTSIARDTRGEPLATERQIAAFAAGLEGFDVGALPAGRGRRPNRGPALVASCPAPPGPETLTALVAFTTVGEPSVSASRCLQAPEGAALARAVRALLEAEARRGMVKIDLVTERLPMPREGALLASLALRPGLDGACHEGRCLAPWHLVVLEAFTRHAPLPSVPDARLGADVAAIEKQLGGAFTRIATRGFLLSKGDVVALGREPSPPMAVDRQTLSRASAAAWHYVRRSQGRDGSFRYLVNPFSGEVVSNDRSIARQAGTTLAICELAPEGAAARKIVVRSLDHLARLERVFSTPAGEAAVLRDDPRSAASEERIGPSALTLAALLRCRPRVGARYDALVARLGRTLLMAQRADGSFHHRVDINRGAPLVARGSLFVDGQVVLALTLLEATAEQDPRFPAAGEVHAAVERAMNHFGGPYWDGFLRPLLFIEENWHCIAAAAALEIHRHDGYERFCIDYVTMKGRIVHEENDGVHHDFIGGYGFGNIVPPHNTATAGYGEALAAALPVMQARGMSTEAAERRLRLVLGFLLRNQWLAEYCHACAPSAPIAGGFSEHMASPLIRIDYVQHAWAALGHGARALGLEGEAL